MDVDVKLDIQPITEKIGARIKLNAEEALKPGVAKKLLDALNTYNVIVLPETDLSPDDLVTLSNAMGDQHALNVTDDKSEVSQQGIYRITLDKTDQQQLEYIRGNDFWHMDGTVYNTPGKATILRCETPPSKGGDTEFANLNAAYDAMPEDLKKRIEGKRIIHNFRAVGRRLYDEPTQAQFEAWDKFFPDTEHPMVWHQKSGRTSLLIGGTADRIAGMDIEESRALIEEVEDFCTSEPFFYAHKWKKGDIVIFNNPSLLHRSSPYTLESGRVMHRTTIVGNEPIQA